MGCGSSSMSNKPSEKAGGNPAGKPLAAAETTGPPPKRDPGVDIEKEEREEKEQEVKIEEEDVSRRSSSEDMKGGYGYTYTSSYHTPQQYAYNAVDDLDALPDEHGISSDGVTSCNPLGSDRVAVWYRELSSLGGSSWNERYQYVLDLKAPSDVEQRKRYTLLTLLARDFVSTAVRYGKLIISELALDEAAKTVPTAKGIGGLAGGEKYVVNGILFKLATDPALSEGNYLYGGSEPDSEVAAKAAANDLRGATNLYSELSDIQSEVRIPLQALVDWGGHRLIAMPLLPISNSTIVYGSNDSGKTVHCSDLVLETAFECVADSLHLRKHRIADSDVSLCMAGDVEGHVGTDSRRYMLDFGRCFPPEAPRVASHLPPPRKASVFYRLLRPEFLKYLKRTETTEPLNADSFSNWTRNDPDVVSHHLHARVATETLFGQVIPAFAQWLTTHLTPISVDVSGGGGNGGAGGGVGSVSGSGGGSVDLSIEAHKRGINMRHLGAVRSCVDQTSFASHVLLVEIVKRTLKNVFRDILRKATPETDNSSFLIQTSAVRFLNLISGGEDPASSTAFWRDIVFPEMSKRYGKCGIEVPQILREDGCESPADALQKMCFEGEHSGPLMYGVVTYVLKRVGLTLTPSCEGDCKRRGVYGFRFSVADVADGVPHVKYMPILEYAEGKMLAREAAELLSVDAEDAHGESGGDGEDGDAALRSQVASHDDANDAEQRRDNERDSEAAARLLELSYSRFQSVVSKQPSSSFAISDMARSLFHSYEVRGESNRADELFISLLRGLSDDGGASESVLKGLLCFLLKQWKLRRFQEPMSKRNNIHVGGASSSKVLRLLVEWVDSIRAQPAWDGLLTSIDVDLGVVKCYWEVTVHCIRDAMSRCKSDLLRKQAEKDVQPFVEGDGILKLGETLRHYQEEREEVWLLLLESTNSGNFVMIGAMQELGFHIDQRDAVTGTTELMRAASAVGGGNIEMVEALLKAGADVRKTDKSGENALCKAIRSGDIDLVRVLLPLFDVRSPSLPHGRTPALFAVSCGASVEMVEALQLTALKDSQDDDGRTALHLAIRAGSLHLCEYLVQTLHVNMNVKDVNGYDCFLTSLMVPDTPSRIVAALMTHLQKERSFTALFSEVAKLQPQPRAELLSEIARAYPLEEVEALTDGQSILHIASINGHLNVARAIVDAGECSLDLHNEDQVTALGLAACHGHADIMEFLLTRGASINENGNQDKYTALHRAVMYGRMSAVKCLLAHGADLNPRDQYEQTPLYKTTMLGHVDVVTVLIEAGANLDAQNSMGETALHRTAREGHFQVAKRLLLAGADSSLRNNKGQTALELGETQGDVANEVCMLLRYAEEGKKGDIEAATERLPLEAKADLGSQSMGLVMASMHGLGEVVKLLSSEENTSACEVNFHTGLDYFEFLPLEIQFGRTALHVAANFIHADVVEALIAAGADVNAVNKFGQTSLHTLSMSDYLLRPRNEENARRIAQALLDAGADLSIRDKQSRTPLTYATRRNIVPLVEMLEAAGAEK